MIPTVYSQLEVQLSILLLAMLRPVSALIAAPFFSALQIPVQLRILIAVAIGLPANSVIHSALPMLHLLSLEGLMMVLSEIVIGIVIGFTLQMAYSSALMAGEMISSAMGLSFSASIDPVNGSASVALSTFFSISATLLLLSTGGHLAFIELIYDSYALLPAGGTHISFDMIYRATTYGTKLFVFGITISLPIVSCLILIQLLVGILSRSAPQLNLFSLSLPLTVLAGLMLLVIGMPAIADGISSALSDGLDQARLTLSGSAE